MSRNIRTRRAGLSVVLAAFSVLAAFTFTPPASAAGGWELEFSEGFDYANGYVVPDGGTWRYSPYIGDSDHDGDTDSSTYVYGGVAHLPVGTQMHTGNFDEHRGETWLIRARVWMPSTSYNHASFWTRAGIGTNATEHEIDVVESWGPVLEPGQNKHAKAAYIWAYWQRTQMGDQWREPNLNLDDKAPFTSPTVKPWNSWHTYEARWSSGDSNIHIAVDGVEVGAIARPAGDPAFPAMMVELTNKHDGTGDADDIIRSEPGSEMLVDWVQVYAYCATSFPCN